MLNYEILVVNKFNKKFIIIFLSFDLQQQNKHVCDFNILNSFI